VSVSQTSADASRPNQRTATLILLHWSSLCLVFSTAGFRYPWFDFGTTEILFFFARSRIFLCPNHARGGPGWLSRYSDSLRAGRPGFESRRFSAPVQTGLGAHPASYTVGTGSFLGLKRPRRGGDHNPQLEPRLKKKYSYICAPVLDLRGLL